MAILGEIRRRPWVLITFVALAMGAFLLNPESLAKVFGKNPNVVGKVNGEEISREEYLTRVMMLQSQGGREQGAAEDRAWESLVQEKIVRQQFKKLGLEITDEYFWSQVEYDPMIAQNPQMRDEKGNFRLQEMKKEIDALRTSNPEGYNSWLQMRSQIEVRMMARQLFSNFSSAALTNRMETAEVLNMRDLNAQVDYVKIDYANFAQRNPVKVSTADLAAYIQKHPARFKSPASVNLGLVSFQPIPAPQDQAVARADMDRLLKGEGQENFQNTNNDSMFIALNSQVPNSFGYMKLEELPSQIATQVQGAPVGSLFGPYTEENRLVVSKLLAHGAATDAKHILIAHKDTPMAAQDKSLTRTKEEALKIANEIATKVRANPREFDQFLQMSVDLGSVQQGGRVGTTMPDDNKFVPTFNNFVKTQPQGAVGVVESEFGYHIIVNELKRPVFKMANLVRIIQPSKATESKNHTNAITFIQATQGKGFNDFMNIAKSKKYNVQNSKNLTRFQGVIPQVESEKDEDILKWAFDSKRKKGDTEIFTSTNGTRIVVYFNGSQEEGLADPESVRDQIEPVVKNQILAKAIMDKIANVSNLDTLAKQFGVAKLTAEVNRMNPILNGVVEPKVAGAAFGVTKGKISRPIQGNAGVYILVKKSETKNPISGDIKAFSEQLIESNAQQFPQILLRSLTDNAEIKDYRAEVLDKPQRN